MRAAGAIVRGVTAPGPGRTSLAAVAVHHRTMRRALAIIVAAGLSGCHINYVDPVRPSLAVIAVTVAPDPLRLLVTCPAGNTNCFGSLDATVTITESGGLGGRVEYVDVTVYNIIHARTDSQIRLDANYLRTAAGTDRIEANGRLALRPTIQGYPFPVGQPPQLEFVLDVRFVDDKGNVIDTNRRVPLQ